MSNIEFCRVCGTLLVDEEDIFCTKCEKPFNGAHQYKYKVRSLTDKK